MKQFAVSILFDVDGRFSHACVLDAFPSRYEAIGYVFDEAAKRNPGLVVHSILAFEQGESSAALSQEDRE